MFYLFGRLNSNGNDHSLSDISEFEVLSFSLVKSKLNWYTIPFHNNCFYLTLTIYLTELGWYQRYVGGSQG